MATRLIVRHTRRIADALPRGSALPEEAFTARHRVLVLLVWLHVPLLFSVALFVGYSVVHAALHVSSIAGMAAFASRGTSARRRALFATLGLLTSSALLVHSLDGLPEAHFHFFVVLIVLSLYEDRVTYGVALVYVVAHHGLAGAPLPYQAFPDGTRYGLGSWAWAGVHGVFFAAAVAASMTLWRLNEVSRSAALREMDDRLRAERDRREADERFARAFEDGPISMAMVTLDRRWLRVNRALSELTGYGPDELVGSPVNGITHPDDRHIGADAIEAVLKGECERYVFEKRLITKSGDEVVVQVTGSIVADDAGRPLYFLSHVLDVTARRLAHERLEYLADHDLLTGLFNRRRFEQELRRQIAHSHGYGNPATLLVVDLDRFKEVNDLFGHAAGDALLARLATAMRERLRTPDIVARLGGDEFAVMLPETTISDARVVVHDLLETIAQVGRVADEDRSVCVTASIGLVELNPDSEQTAEALLMDADVAMYEAKGRGRDRYVVAPSAPAGERTVKGGRFPASRTRQRLDRESTPSSSRPPAT